MVRASLQVRIATGSYDDVNCLILRNLKQELTFPQLSIDFFRLVLNFKTCSVLAHDTAG